TAGWFAPATAADSRLDDIRKKQTENTDEITTAEQELTTLKGQRDQLQAAVNDLNAQLDAAQQHLTAVQADIDRYAVAALLLSDEMQKTQKKLDQARAATRKSAVLLYQRRSDSSGVLDLIGPAGGSGRFIEGKQYLEHVSDLRHRDADRVGALRADLAATETQLTSTRQQADTARDQAVADQQRIQGLSGQQQQALAAANASEADYNAKLNTLVAQKNELAAEFQKVSDEIAAELARASQMASLVNATPTGNGTFIRPIPGAPI